MFTASSVIYVEGWCVPLKVSGPFPSTDVALECGSALHRLRVPGTDSTVCPMSQRYTSDSRPARSGRCKSQT